MMMMLSLFYIFFIQSAQHLNFFLMEEAINSVSKMREKKSNDRMFVLLNIRRLPEFFHFQKLFLDKMSKE